MFPKKKTVQKEKSLEEKTVKEKAKTKRAPEKPTSAPMKTVSAGSFFCSEQKKSSSKGVSEYVCSSMQNHINIMAIVNFN